MVGSTRFLGQRDVRYCIVALTHSQTRVQSTSITIHTQISLSRPDDELEADCILLNISTIRRRIATL